MKSLIFVYNADAGFFNMVTDIAHKIWSPATYPCSLCDLTYGVLKIRPEWDDFVKSAPVPLVFLHKDEFQEAYPDWRAAALPLVLIHTGAGLETLIRPEELNTLPSVAALKKMVLERL